MSFNIWTIYILVAKPNLTTYSLLGGASLLVFVLNYFLLYHNGRYKNFKETEMLAGSQGNIPYIAYISLSLAGLILSTVVNR